MVSKNGLRILNAQAQCNWGWYEDKRCHVKGIENLIWVQNQLFCKKHAEIVRQAILKRR